MSNNNETEVTVYVRITNPEGLKEASGYEDIVQAEALLGKDHQARTRVRQTTVPGEDSRYTQTLKLPRGTHVGVASMDESTTEIEEDYYLGFLAAADTIQEKTRYHFASSQVSLVVSEEHGERTIEVPSVKYEVDVFKKADGSIHEWAKIDVEVDDILTYLEHNHPEIKDVKFTVKVSHLPFKPEGGFIAENASDAQRIFLDQLWQSIYLDKEAYLGKLQQA